MKVLLSLVLAATAAVVAVVATTAAVDASRATPEAAAQAQLAGPPRVQPYYGHIRSLIRKGARFELGFDPAFWLGGVTANRAAVEDKVISPGDIVPNDYYIREEGSCDRYRALARPAIPAVGG